MESYHPFSAPCLFFLAKFGCGAEQNLARSHMSPGPGSGQGCCSNCNGMSSSSCDPIICSGGGCDFNCSDGGDCAVIILVILLIILIILAVIGIFVAIFFMIWGVTASMAIHTQVLHRQTLAGLYRVRDLNTIQREQV